MPWVDSGLFVVTSGVSGQLQHFSSKIFHHCSQVNWGASTNAFGIVAFAQHSVDTTDRELETSTAAAALCLSLGFTTFTSLSFIVFRQSIV